MERSTAFTEGFVSCNILFRDLTKLQVHKEFGKLFDMKIMVFALELLSVVITPFVLCFSLPNSAPAIIDFFREFTIHVDGLGYVCSFAKFDFKRHGNVHVGFHC